MPCPLPRRPARQLLSSLCHELWQAKGCTDTGIRMSISPCSRPREREQETQLPSFTTCRSLGGETETEGRCGLPYHPPPATPSQWGIGGVTVIRMGPGSETERRGQWPSSKIGSTQNYPPFWHLVQGWGSSRPPLAPTLSFPKTTIRFNNLLEGPRELSKTVTLWL